MRATVLNGVGVLNAEGEFQPVTGQQGAVLAALVAAFPDSVSFDELIDSLWRGRPTKTARNGLSVVVNRLRSKLVDHGLGLVTEGHSYRLDATVEDIDLHAFYSELEQARSASSHSEPEKARGLLTVALSRWRGEPFRSHLDIDRVAVEAARAAGARADAEEMLAATLLELHEPESAASLATELTIAEPLREYRWELLMRALYRSGRGAEALRAYDRVTTLLRTELGIDPGPSLRELHLAILNNDSALDIKGAVSGWTHRPQIERRTHIAGPATSFVGREHELKALESLFRGGRLVTILGPGGAGKTRLAREFVGLRPDEPPLWVELAAVDSSGVVGLLNGHFERRDGAVDDPRMLAESLRSWAGTIVFDNCEHVVDTIAPIAEAIAQTCPDVRVLATSRIALGTESEVRLDATPLDDAAAIDLVLDRTFGAGPTSDFDDDDLLAIVRQVDALPLTLELVAGLLRHRSPGTITARLADSISDLTAPRRLEPRHRDLAETIDWSLDLLPRDVARTFETLAVMNGPFSGSDASALLGSDIEAHLSNLADSSLLTVVGTGKRRQFHMLETMRVHARGRLDGRGELDDLLDRHSCTFAKIAVDLAAFPGDTASGDIESRLDQFGAAFRHASGRDHFASMVDLVRSLNPYFKQHRMFSEARWIVDLASHCQFDSLPDHLELRAKAAHAAWFVGDFDRVEELLAETRAEAVATRNDLPCLVHNVEFRIAANRRDIDTAATALLAWVDAARTQGDANEAFESMSALAAGSIQTEHYDNADACAAETMRLAVEQGSEGWLAAARYTTAYVDYARRAASESTDLEEALRGFVEGRRLAVSSGNGLVAGWCDDMATACLRRMGRLQEAAELVTQTLRRWEAKPASTHLGLNQVLRELVMILHADGRLTEAARVSQARRSLAVSSLLCPADEQAIALVEAKLGSGTAPTNADPIKVALDVLR